MADMRLKLCRLRDKENLYRYFIEFG